MSKETEARDVALNEYNEFMGKYKSNIEAGDMKLMQHMLRLEANKIRTQSILDSIEKSAANIDGNVYGNAKMKMQMSQQEYHTDQAPDILNQSAPKKLDKTEKAFIEMATKPIAKPITIGDPDKMDNYFATAADFGQLTTEKEFFPAVDKHTKMKDLAKEAEKNKVEKLTPSITVDPKTGKKVYKGPKLRSRKIVDGKTWDNSHPNFHDKQVGGM